MQIEIGTLQRIQKISWVLLISLAVTAWLCWSLKAAYSIFMGGFLANCSFYLLKRDLLKLLQGPLNTVKAQFFLKYYIRFTAVVIVLFVLIKYQLMDIIALLIGLSTIFLSIGLTVLSETKKFFFKMKEAS